MKISVYGSALGGIDDKIKNEAREIGREIARNKYILITGACPGYPYEAVRGAAEEKGEVIGFSPATCLEEHKTRFGFPAEGFTEFVWAPVDFPYRENKGACLKLRNVYSVAACNAAIIIGGRWGTVNEFSIAYDLGKNIGVLAGSGGFTDFIVSMMKNFNKKSDSNIIFSSSPKNLVFVLGDIPRV